ncbi:ArsR/SmtB family transcription factor [Subtercola endophyticus]|uniref:ArsR/SmtB family transcription factor n=1 Tax=Subtercola endophyticus TaxID=2895559 RepID=UPI001E366E5C|nr:helix-turn-helix transcriptional regulator [Subtercola endophyticus]UFS58121.1 ArsR family transcriptional regulator [Subtercola endophyticus]
MIEPLIGFGDAAAADRACAALGITPTRIEILRVVLASGDVSASELALNLGLSRNGVLHHLRALTEGGLLRARHCTHPRGSGPITYWRADEQEVRSVLHDVDRHLFTDSSSPSVRP